MDRPKVTIKDVAKHASVGVGTVSRVMNDTTGVSPRIRQQVEKSIEALGYQPDSSARSLRTQKTDMVAFFVNDISNVAFSTIAKGIHEELEKNGYHLLLYNTGDEGVEEKIFESIKVRKYDGIILSLQDESKLDYIKQIADNGTPFILLDREVKGMQVDAVLTDYYNGIRSAAEYLISLGHRKIGYIGSQSNIRPVRESTRGFLDAMKLNGLNVSDKWIKLGGFSIEYGAAAARQLIEEEKVTAMIAGSNQILIGCMETIREMNINIPEQLSIIGFEDAHFVRLMNPSITVVIRPLLQIGRQMAGVLLDKIKSHGKKNKEQPVTLIVPTTLLIRDSCSSPPIP